MSLSKREKVLAGAVATLLVLVGVWLLFRAFGGPLETRRDQLAALIAKRDQYVEQVAAAKQAQDRVAEWSRRALPSDPARAGSLYQNWLLELAGKAGFRQKRVEPGAARPRGEFFYQLPFTVYGHATLDELVQFLFEFYSAGHLHQIRRVTIKPIEKSQDLDLVITIDALSMPSAKAPDGSPRTDRLCSEPGNRLALKSLEEYRKAIGVRNVLAAYRPPAVVKPREKAPEEPKPEPFDPSKHAFVTAIVAADGKPEVWIKARTTDEKFQLHEGDAFKIGPLQATVARIHQREVEIEAGGQRYTVPLGGEVRKSEPDAKGN